MDVGLGIAIAAAGIVLGIAIGATGIGGVLRIAGDDAVGRNAHATADAAIRTGGVDHAACHCGPASAATVSGAALSAGDSVALACSAKARVRMSAL